MPFGRDRARRRRKRLCRWGCGPSNTTKNFSMAISWALAGLLLLFVAASVPSPPTRTHRPPGGRPHPPRRHQTADRSRPLSSLFFAFPFNCAYRSARYCLESPSVPRSCFTHSSCNTEDPISLHLVDAY